MVSGGGGGTSPTVGGVICGDEGCVYMCEEETELAGREHLGQALNHSPEPAVHVEKLDGQLWD